MEETLIDRLTTLRRTLHANPELSSQESQTARRILEFMNGMRPDRIIQGIGGHGLAVVFEGAEPGPAVGFRCELDALPIQEVNQFAHRSKTEGVSHKCGHDGHMAVIAGLGCLASRRRPRRGKLVLIFQPAEETGLGGPRYVADKAFEPHVLDEVYALHNLPDYPHGTVVLRDGAFTCASKGLTVRLHGATAHAASPEDGVSPALPMCRIIEGLTELPSTGELQAVFCRVTVVGSRLGEAAFGTAPGYAEIWATLRTDSDEAMCALTVAAEELVAQAADAGGLRYETGYCDEFAVTRNHTEAVARIERSAAKLDCPVVRLPEALRFSEDFGCFTQNTSGAMFGLGSGPGPKLHNADYDFPDSLIPVGLALFREIAAELLDM